MILHRILAEPGDVPVNTLVTADCLIMPIGPAG
jgi:hypothetical protein